jgi:hypothetical protein
MKRAIACATMMAALAACSGGQKAPAGGKVAAVVRAVSQSSVVRVNVSIQPANVSQDLTRDTFTGNFTGTLITPVGPQTVTATAYDASNAVVGSGSVSVVVTLGGTVNAFLKILDTTGPPPAPDHGPIVTSLVASNTGPSAGEAVTLTATAIDPDGDPMTYAWSQDCTSGVFSATAGPSTTWSSPVAGACKLTVTVTSKGLVDAVSANVVVFPAGGGQGAVAVNGVFVEQPVINFVSVSDAGGGYFYGTLYRTGDATLRTPVAPRQRLNFSIDSYSSGTEVVSYGLSDDCGGTITGGYGWWQWTAPAKAGLCMVTASKSVDGLSDSFPVAVYVSGCALDQYEHNDSAMQAATLMSTGPGFSATGLTANDDDWFRAWVTNPGDPTVTVSINSQASLSVDLVAADGLTVLASGTNLVTANLGPNYNYYVHVKPPALAPGTCGPTYDLAIMSGSVTGPISVSVMPDVATVRTNGQLQLTATVSGTTNQAVNWNLSDYSCGWVDSMTGIFNASSEPRSGCVVTATSQLDPSKSASATIDVVAPRLTGAVAYAGAAKGPVQIVYNWSGVNGQTAGGTSIATPGAFAIRGLQGSGTATVLAWIDTLGIGRFNAAADPFGSVTLPVSTSGTTFDVGTITLTDPSATTAPAMPTNVTVTAFAKVANVRWTQPRNGGGFETADHYTVYWSGQPNPGPGNNTGSFTVQAASGRVRLHGFTPGSQLYFSVTASAAGLESAPAQVPTAVTFATPTGNNTIIGNAVPPAFTGAMVVYAYDPISGMSYPASVFNDTAPLQPFTYNLAVPDGTYQIFAYTDNGDDQLIGPTDPSSFQTPYATLTVAGSQVVSGPDVVFTDAGALASVVTRMFAPSDPTFPASYNVGFNVKSNLKRPVAAVFSLPAPPAPLDLGVLNTVGQNLNLTQFSASLSTGNGGPTVGDSGAITVTYDDGISEDIPVTITGVFQAAPSAVSPIGSAPTIPGFLWSPPSIPPAGAYTYTINVNAQVGGASMWSISGISSSQTSIGYAGAPLVSGQAYTWTVRAVDAFGNFGQSAPMTFTAM